MSQNFLQYIIDIFYACLGGLVRILTQNKEEPTPLKFISGIIVSAFVGIIVFSLCKEYQISDNLTAVFTAISGYIGTPLIDYAFNIFKKIIDKKTD